MQLKDLIALHRSDTDDVAEPPKSSKDDVIGWLNEAEEEACIRARLIFDKTSSITELQVYSGDTVLEIDRAINEIEYARLVDSGGESYRIHPTDRIELDRATPDWRTTTDRPQVFIHDDLSIEFGCIVDADYTLKLEVYRKPFEPMKLLTDEPEIHDNHHRMLVHWSKYRHYSRPDVDVFDAKLAAEAYAAFEDYFGPRPDASIRRKQLANKPHTNKACW